MEFLIISDRDNEKKGISADPVAVLMTLIVLSVTNYFIVLSQKDYQSRVAERLLQYSERVAGQLADAIEVAESSGIAGCTPAGINLLRTIRQKINTLMI